ncbi:MAG: hypothetical protein WBQ34_19125 [Candidatus Acidiferrales bacterium]
MARTTFQKRQKEMKRMEKQRMKAERRAQRKEEKTAEPGAGAPIEFDDSFQFGGTDADEVAEEA